MEALKDLGVLFLILVGIVMAIYLAHEFWWFTAFIAGFVVVLLVIKYVVDGRFRE